MINPILIKLAARATNLEKMSWERRVKNMEKLIDKIRPIESQILDLQEKKQKQYDKLAEVRQEAVDLCVHPLEHLVLVDDTIDTHSIVECKFCNKRLTVTKDEST